MPAVQALSRPLVRPTIPLGSGWSNTQSSIVLSQGSLVWTGGSYAPSPSGIPSFRSPTVRVTTRPSPLPMPHGQYIFLINMAGATSMATPEAAPSPERTFPDRLYVTIHDVVR